MKNFYTKKTTILHSETRIIEDVDVQFNIVSVKRSWFWGLFQVTAKAVVPKYNYGDVPVLREQKFNAGVKSIKYALIQKHWDELTNHLDD